MQTLAIHGGMDTLVPLVLMKQTQDHFKNFVVLEKGGHFIPN